jgi:TfoX/Sxy family transcriptional regulator of competence genes
MAYDEKLAGRVRAALSRRAVVEERKMFGGLAFLVKGSMTCGIVGDELMVRVGPDRHEEALARPNVRPMDFTGRPMRGMVFVAPPGLASAPALARWVELALAAAPPRAREKPSAGRRARPR